MRDTTSINLRIDKDLKKQAEELFETLGLNMTTAMNVFLRQAVREQGLPFKITAQTDYNSLPAYRGNLATTSDYDFYVSESLKATDLKVAEGNMKYYTADEIRSRLEEVLNEEV